MLFKLFIYYLYIIFTLFIYICILFILFIYYVNIIYNLFILFIYFLYIIYILFYRPQVFFWAAKSGCGYIVALVLWYIYTMVVPRLYINEFEGFLDYTYVGKPYILDWNGIGIWIPVLLLVSCYNPLRLCETDLKLIL